jgi:hypothetical protein
MATSDVTTPAPPNQSTAVKLLVGVQLLVVAIYVAGTLVPYLLYFVLPGRPLFSATRPNIAPSEVFGGGGGLLDPVNWLVILGFLVTELGVALTGVLSLAGVAALAVTWRRGRSRVRIWAVVGVVSCVALLAFQLTPLGGDLANWVLD